MRPIIPVLMIVSLILLAGCAEPVTQYQCWDGSIVDSIEGCPEPESQQPLGFPCWDGTIVDSVDECPVPPTRKTCRELGGYLCDSKDACTSGLLDNTDLYCCQTRCKQPRCPTSCDDDNACTLDYCEATTDYKCVHEKLDDAQTGCSGSAGTCKEFYCDSGVCLTKNLWNCCGNEACEEGETFSNCPGDCENPCPAACKDNDPFTVGFCDETTNYECIFEEATCGEDDGICPKNGAWNDPNAGCYLADDPNCNLIYSFKSQPKTSGHEFTGNTAFDGNTIYYRHVYAWDISQPELIITGMNLSGESFGAIEVEGSYIYIGTQEGKILIFNKNTYEKVAEINVDEDSNLTGTASIGGLRVDEKSIYASVPPYGVLIFDKNTHQLVNSLSVGGYNLLVDSQYLYLDDGSQVGVYDKNTFTEVKSLEHLDVSDKIDSSENYFVILEYQPTNYHRYLKIWDKRSWQIHRIIDIGMFVSGVVVDENQIYIGRSLSGDFIQVFDWNGEEQGRLWGNHGHSAIPVYLTKDYIIVYSRVAQEDSSGENFLQKWKRSI